MVNKLYHQFYPNMNEFDIIKYYFAEQTEERPDVLNGIGDDGAVVKVLANHELVITTDTLIAGTHFPMMTSARDIGHKSLAVNLSDLAAMGASPSWVTLALSLPAQDKSWLSQFCEGFFSLAKQYQVQLIGGDLTQGPLSITITAMGFIPTKKAILRSRAKVGDLIYVTGTLGDAGLALAFLQNKIQLEILDEQAMLAKLNRPEPRILCGQKILGFANAAIDISDGLIADLSHMLELSGVGAHINVDLLPFSPTLRHLQPRNKAIEFALTAGDDYELCFTVPPKKCKELEAKLSLLPHSITCIGEIIAQKKLQLCYQDGSNYYGSIKGYQHF